MDPGLFRDAVTVLLGLATGMLSGLFGVGGGVISQPGMRLLGVEPLVAIGTALPVIVPGAASGTLRYSREKLIAWSAVVATVPVGLVAAATGGLLADEVPGKGHLLQLATAGLLGISAWHISRPSGASSPDEEPLAESDAPDTTPIYLAIGGAAGMLSGLLGIGGGVLMVPAFVRFASMPVKRAIATSLTCVGAFAIPGTITHAIEGHIAWGAAAALIIGVIPGAGIGAHVAIAATDRRLRMAVSGFLGVIAVLYAGGELLALAD